MTDYSTLNTELWWHICKFLSPLGLIILARTCRHLNSILPLIRPDDLSLTDAVAYVSHLEVAWPMLSIRPKTEYFVKLAAREGNVDVVKWFTPMLTCKMLQPLLEVATRKGDTCLLTWLFSTAVPCTCDGKHFQLNVCLSTLAVRCGCTDTFKLLYANGLNVDEYTTLCMIKSERWDMLAWAQENNLPFNRKVCMEIAAGDGKLRTMQRLFSEYGCTPAICGNNIVYLPILSGHLNVAKWAYTQGFAVSHYCALAISF